MAGNPRALGYLGAGLGNTVRDVLRARAVWIEAVTCGGGDAAPVHTATGHLANDGREVIELVDGARSGRPCGALG